MISRIAFSIAFLIAILVLPQFLDFFQNGILDRVVLFLVMGLGLNIVVGYAGLLDLGYVAFFGIGAYTYGLLSAPESYVLVNIPAFSGVSFWGGILIAILAGVIAALIAGEPSIGNMVCVGPP